MLRNTPAPIIMPNPIMVMWNSDSSRDSSGAGALEADDCWLSATGQILKCLAARAVAGLRYTLYYPARPQRQDRDKKQRADDQYTACYEVFIHEEQRYTRFPPKTQHFVMLITH